MQIICQGQIPTRATDGSAGYDLHAAVAAEVGPGQMAKVKTGTKLAMRTGMVGLLFIRSGLAAKNQATLQNCVGVIDSDFRGEIIAMIRNEGDDPIKIAAGDRVAQIVFTPFFSVHFEKGIMPETDRGEGGLGSTGK